ncbi:MAG TPA: (Fe-S)-binding protein [Syntrophales bacterium]|nr:(Fe-S)-binding protein [Syntrophales bacterium]
MAGSGLIDEPSRCMKCGFCMSACPVYGVDHIESHVARGRNMLINWAGNNELTLDNSYRNSLYHCLLCRRCETVCPARISSAAIALQARANLVQQKVFTWPQRFIHRGIVKHRALVAKALGLAAWLPRFAVNEGRPLRHLADFASMLSTGLSIPRLSKPFLSERIPYRTFPPSGTRVRGEVAVFPGCAFEFFFAGIGQDVVMVLAEAGFEVVNPAGLTCCGLAVQSAGDTDTAALMARQNIEVLSHFDHIITGCATCGSAFRNYENWFPENDAYQAKAHNFSERVEDLSEFLIRQEFESPGQRDYPVTVTYHDPCHLRWHQGVSEEPRKILNSIEGVNYIEMEGADKCCGLGGSFGITHRDVSLAILDKKMESIKKTGAEVVVTSCPGCMIQLMDGVHRHRLSIDVMHISQLIRGQKEPLRTRR